MRKIIKPGAEKFIMTCTRCGCEYSYEIEDIGKSSLLTFPSNAVECPQCRNVDVHIKENATF